MKKPCSKCKKEKPLSEFGKNKRYIDGYVIYCKECVKIYYQKNKNLILIERKKFPWKRTLVDIKQRCNNSKNNDYKYYGGRGIKCLITKEEIKKLWLRDKTYLMIRPSIDRENNDVDYIYDNCRFIEMVENSIKDKKKPILQYDLDGKFIKEWKAIIDVEKKLKIHHSGTVTCLKKKNKNSWWIYLEI